MEFLNTGSIGSTIAAVCGVVCLCGGGLLVIGFIAFRVIAGGSIFSGLSYLGALFDNFKQDDDDELDDPVERIHSIRHAKPSDLKSKAKESFDFEQQIAQQMQRQSGDFDSQSTNKPPKSGRSGQSSGTFGQQSANNQQTSDNTPASSLGKRRLGARDRYNSRDDMLPEETNTPEIDLGPIDIPDSANIKWQKNRPGRDRRQNRNRNDDEVFGGMLDDDGDGFPDF